MCATPCTYECCLEPMFRMFGEYGLVAIPDISDISEARNVRTYESPQSTCADARQCNDSVPIHFMRARPPQVAFLEKASSGMREAVRAADEAAAAVREQLQGRDRELLRQRAEAEALRQALAAASEDQAQYMSMVASPSDETAIRSLPLTDKCGPAEMTNPKRPKSMPAVN